MHEIINMLDGPYTDEAAFKKAFIRSNAKNQTAIFCIETEETVPGFPDMLCIAGGMFATLIEFKHIKEDGRISFRQPQLLFYRQHANLRVFVYVWDSRSNRMFVLTPEEVLAMEKLSFPFDDIFKTTLLETDDYDVYMEEGLFA